jgi:hypothetical protein
MGILRKDILKANEGLLSGSRNSSLIEPLAGREISLTIPDRQSCRIWPDQFRRNQKATSGLKYPVAAVKIQKYLLSSFHR